MEEDKIKLNAFLAEKGIDPEKLTLEEKRVILKKLFLINDIDRDFEELKYKQNPNSESQDEYCNKIKNLVVERLQIQDYILIISKLERETRKLKRKEVFQKIISPFRNKK